MTDRLDWRVAIIGYDRMQWVRYLNAYAQQSGEPEPSMDDGRRKTHLVQYIDDEDEDQECTTVRSAGLSATARQLELHKLRRATLEVVKRAFEAVGVEFIDANNGGAGLRLANARSDRK